MPGTHPSYPPDYRRRIIELAQVGFEDRRPPGAGVRALSDSNRESVYLGDKAVLGAGPARLLQRSPLPARWRPKKVGKSRGPTYEGVVLPLWVSHS